MERLGELGVQVQITEMDVRIEDGAGNLQDRLNAQANVYREMATVCGRSRACTELTTWGVTDRYTWTADSQPASNAPLLFDMSYQPKLAYHAVRAVLGEP